MPTTVHLGSKQAYDRSAIEMCCLQLCPGDVLLVIAKDSETEFISISALLQGIPHVAVWCTLQVSAKE